MLKHKENKMEKKMEKKMSNLEESRVFSISGDTTKFEMERLMEIQIDKITETFDYQARKFFNKDVIEKLAENMRINGFIQNIIVVKNGIDTYKIVAGETRYRAAKLAKIPTLKALVFPETTSMQKLVGMSVSENQSRNSISPYEVFLICRKALNEKKATTYRELSLYFGGVYDVSLIKKAMAYEELHKDVIVDAENGINVSVEVIATIRAATKRLINQHPEESMDDIYKKNIKPIYEDVKKGNIEIAFAVKVLKALGVEKNEDDRVSFSKHKIEINTRYLSDEQKAEIENEIRRIIERFLE